MAMGEMMVMMRRLPRALCQTFLRRLEVYCSLHDSLTAAETVLPAIVPHRSESRLPLGAKDEELRRKPCAAGARSRGSCGPRDKPPLALDLAKV